MNDVSRWFLRLGVASALVGMSMGIGMGMAQDFTLAPAHAHLNLLGWVSMMLYGLAYHVVPGMAEGRLPRVHFAMATVGMLLMVPGIAMVVMGHHEGEPVAIAGSLVTIGSMLLFAVILYRATAAQGRRVASLAEAPA